MLLKRVQKQHERKKFYWSMQQRRQRTPRLKCALSRQCGGQATVEYVVVGVILVMIIVALGMLASRAGEGLFVQHAADSASHAFTTNTAGSIGDVLLY